MREAYISVLLNLSVASVPRCPKGEEWNYCAVNKDCEPNCEGTHEYYCDRQCHQRCQCSGGLLRDLSTGRCLEAQYCPRKIIAQPECPENEVWNECGNLCDGTCEQPQKECSRICAEGACACAKNYVRNHLGNCVSSETCQKESITVSPECPKNEFWNVCGNLCEGTCEQPLMECPKICAEPACTCRAGFVRNENGICISEFNCKPRIHCPMNSVYNECGSHCPETCETSRAPVLCALSCNPSCECIEGYVLDSNGECIEKDLCFKTNPKCPPNSTFNECGTNCPQTCDTFLSGLPVMCNFGCNPSCQCDQGFVLDENNNCIKQDECRRSTPECPKYSSFNECGTNCPETCESYLSGYPLMCNFGCNPSCQCDNGFVLDENENCIPKDQCRLSSPECPENSSYNTCGTNCEDTCDSILNEYPVICNFGCNEGCFCNEGFVRQHIDGTCVPVESCNRVPKLVTVCEENRSWSECKTQKYCDGLISEDFQKEEFYTLECSAGCQCNAGLYQNNQGKCVSYEECLSGVESVSDKDNATENLQSLFEFITTISNDSDITEAFNLLDQLENLSANDTATVEGLLLPLIQLSNRTDSISPIQILPSVDELYNATDSIHYGYFNDSSSSAPGNYSDNGYEEYFKPGYFDKFADIGEIISSLAEGIPDFDPCENFGHFLCDRSCLREKQCFQDCINGLCALREIEDFEDITEELVVENRVPVEIFTLFTELNEVFSRFEDLTDFSFEWIRTFITKWDLRAWLEEHFCNHIGKRITLDDVERATNLSLKVSTGDFAAISELSSFYDDILRRPNDTACYINTQDSMANSTNYILEGKPTDELYEYQHFDLESFSKVETIITYLAEGIPDFNPCAQFGQFLCERSCEKDIDCVGQCTAGLCILEEIDFSEISEDMVHENNVPLDIFGLFTDFFNIYSHFGNAESINFNEVKVFLSKWELVDWLEQHFCNFTHKNISIDDIGQVTTLSVKVSTGDFTAIPNLVSLYEEILARPDAPSCLPEVDENIEEHLFSPGKSTTEKIAKQTVDDKSALQDDSEAYAEAVSCQNKYELFVDCGPKQECRITCETYYTGINSECDEYACVPGCICPYGWLLNETQEKCVRDPRQCSIPYHLYMPYV